MRTTPVQVVLIFCGLGLIAGCARPDVPASPEPPAATAAAVVTADPNAAVERTFENDDFILTLPAGWGVSMSGGEYFDLGTTEVVTFHNQPLITDSGAFLTVSVDELEQGQSLQDRVEAAYAVQKTEIEDLAQRAYEQGGLEGIEATYRRPWGEPWWRFRDVWFEVNGSVYLLSFMASPNTFDERAGVFDAMLQSYSFKD